MKLLFIGGAGSGGAGWANQVRHFSGSEAIALPGHPEGKPCSSIEEYVEWLRGYIRHRGYRDVVLVGHSMGSAIAQVYALQYGEELKALVLVGGGARLKVLPSRLRQVEGMIRDESAWKEFLAGEYSHIDPEVRKDMIEEGGRIGAAVSLNDSLCCDGFDIMDKVRLIRLPTLIICGSADDRTPAKYSHYLAGRIEGAREIIIEGASHWVHLDRPAEVNQAIDDFLARLA